MEDAPVSFIRESTRNLLKLNRRMQRDEESDARRLVDNMSISSDQISDIASRLKSKSQVSTPELQLLKNALIDDMENLSIVLGTQGALRGIVREISGTDVKRQCAAAGCCCNLALGDSKSCWAVAKATGSYLVAALHSLTDELAVTCAWALGNLSGSGPRVGLLLASQGAVTKLTASLDRDEDVRDAALYALVHFAYQLKDDLCVEHLEKIMEALFKLECSMASSQLLFILSCHKHFENTELSEQCLHELLKATAVSTGRHVSTCKQNHCCELVYLFRALANLVISEKVSSLILNHFVENDVYKLGFPKMLISENRTLVESLLWLLGVLYKCCDQKEIFEQIIGVPC